MKTCSSGSRTAGILVWKKELETLNETLSAWQGKQGTLAADVGTAERVERSGCDAEPDDLGILTVSLKGTISEQEMERLQSSLKEMRQNWKRNGRKMRLD